MGFLIKVASLLILFQTLFTTLNSAFIGLDKMEVNALIMNAQAIVKTALSPLLVVLGFSVVGALAGHIISYVIASLAGSLILLKLYRGLGKSQSGDFPSSLKVMLGYGFPLYTSTLLGLFLGQYQTIILAFFASNAEIGNFSIALNLSSIINLLVLGYLFNRIGETKVAFKSSMINLLVFLPLAPTLTIPYHVPGLIVASLVSGLLSLAYGLFIAVKKIDVSLDLKASLRIYLASFTSAIPVLAPLHISPLNNLLNLAINGPMFLLTYLTLPPLTRAVHQPDLENLKLIFSKLKIVWPFLKPVLAYEAKLPSTFRSTP